MEYFGYPHSKSFTLSMVEQKFVRKRIGKKVATVVTGLCSGTAVVLMLVAFLGYRVGSFTVKLRQSNVKLVLTQDTKSATDGKTEMEGTDTTNNSTYLLVSSMPSFELHTDSKLQDHDRYDNGDTDFLDGALVNPKTGEVVSLYYFKYTFFIKNIGQVSADYQFNLRIAENQQPTNIHSYGYDDILRVRLYQNVGDTHEYTTYAKPPRDGAEGHYNENGEFVYEEKVSKNSTEYATNFIDASNVVNLQKDDFEKGDYIRYTIMMWLEGSDPQCEKDPPVGGSIKLEISITATESQRDEN